MDPKDELDSHMFQTIGHDIIHLYPNCFLNPNIEDQSTSIFDAPPLPLFRREIKGFSKSQDKYYQRTQDDEVEDLYELLKEVKEKIPDVEGVSVGAILSNYQRVRVENVCQRLRLTSFAYLWQQDQETLLQKMVECGMESMLVKVAAMGLDQKHLGKTIGQLGNHLINMNRKYDLHVCGEGGEYETSTLDCPLFRRRIVVDERRIHTHSDDHFAPVVYLTFEKMHLEDKPVSSIPSLADSASSKIYSNVKEWCREHLIIPPISPKEDARLSRETLRYIAGSTGGSEVSKYTHHTPPSVPIPQLQIKPQMKRVGNFYHVAGLNLHSVVPGFAEEDCTETNIDEEIIIVMNKLQYLLRWAELNMSDIVSTNLYVSSMSDFARINAGYSKYFSINPPARACVEVALPKPLNVLIDVVVYRRPDPEERDTLHVQSISYWASANIGPYSQSVKVSTQQFIAGQIGLIPHSMSLPNCPATDKEVPNYRQFLTECAISLRNLSSILTVTSTRKDELTLCICYVTSPAFIPVAENEWKRWYYQIQDSSFSSAFDTNIKSDSEEENDNADSQEGIDSDTPTPLCIVVVPTLPKNGVVEWQTSAYNREWRRLVKSVDTGFDTSDEEEENGSDGITRRMRNMELEKGWTVKGNFKDDVVDLEFKGRRLGNLATLMVDVGLNVSEHPESLATITASVLEQMRQAISHLSRNNGKSDACSACDAILSLRIFHSSTLSMIQLQNAFEVAFTEIGSSKEIPALILVPVNRLKSNKCMSICANVVF
ncbi:hypothetical protein BKA69DRAFT_1065709 [Paraphysoderma sedebokerense]|nr:hypothetical protein BKA69DRAFT_1065709 [Paraphysoderma sedebokerense]